MSVFYRIHFGECATELHELIPPSPFHLRVTRRRLGFHPYVVDIPPIRTKRFAPSFVTRTAKEWNTLPADLFPEQYNLGLFKARVSRHYLVSYAVKRGKPFASQIYLDGILDAVLEQDKDRGRPVRTRDRINVAEVIYYSMRKRPSSILMINGSEGKTFTNEEMLKRVVPLSRALIAKGTKGKRVVMVMRNHVQLSSLYYASLFTGVIPLLLDPLSTEYELNHFFALVDPCIVFCDRDRYDDVIKAVKRCGLPPTAVITEDEIEKLGAGQSDDLDSYAVTDVEPEATAVLLPTSGSTGLAKAAIITHQALLVHIPTLWIYHTQFPTPTERAMFLSTAQWMTYSNLSTACPVYDITMVMSPLKTPEHAVELFEKSRPTWVLLVPGTAKILSSMVKAEQVTSLRTVVVTGARPTTDTIAKLKSLLPADAHLCNSYGMTETQGFVAVPDKVTPIDSPGKIINIMEYKLVDDDGKDVTGPNHNGELYFKNDICITKGYLNNEEAYKECIAPGGWWKTGDVFYSDEEENLFFVQRKKIWFKYLNYHIAPEELENVISGVPGVMECVVCGSEDGAATAVVVQPGCEVTREQIHAAINSTLIEYKRLRGGIAFVDSLPRTHSGKLHRTDCTKLVEELIKKGLCF